MKQEENITEQRHWKYRKALILLIIAAFISTTVGAGVYWWTRAYLAKSHPRAERVQGLAGEEETEQFIAPPHKLNIILLGVDERPADSDPGRSDTLLVMMIDTKTRVVSLISVPRDTRARVMGRGWDKINHAFAYGGVALTQQTTENFLGIPMNYYAKVDLASFGRVVDAIGGVTIDVEKRMQYEDTWDHFVIDLKPGIQRLDGRTALQFVRYRDEEGDIGRVRRQQKFITAVLAEMNTPHIILKLPGIIREIVSSLDTDMPLPIMLALAHQLKAGMSVGIRTNMVEGLPYYIDEISYWVPNVMKTRQMVSEMQGVPFSGDIRAAAQKLADEYSRNLPSNAHLDNGDSYSVTKPIPIKPTPVQTKSNAATALTAAPQTPIASMPPVAPTPSPTPPPLVKTTPTLQKAANSAQPGR